MARSMRYEVGRNKTNMMKPWLWLCIMALDYQQARGLVVPSMVLKLPAKYPVVICPGFGNDARDCKQISHSRVARTNLLLSCSQSTAQTDRDDVYSGRRIEDSVQSLSFGFGKC